MSRLSGKKTQDYLVESFKKEAADALRYLYLAKRAEIEGLPEAARLFRKFAQGGECNAHGCLDFLDSVENTEHNLETAVLSETGAGVDQYPGMAQTARREGLPDIASWFETLAKLKKAHAEELAKTLKK